jgi:anaerobic C4-dicarboxylate transporter
MRTNQTGDQKMGKYVIAWLLGVPGIVLVIVYIFFH